jgi:hypothetical protein
MAAHPQVKPPFQISPDLIGMDRNLMRGVMLSSPESRISNPVKPVAVAVGGIPLTILCDPLEWGRIIYMIRISPAEALVRF